MKRLVVSFALVFVFCLPLSTLSAENAKKELPFYFPPGVISTQDSVGQWQEYLRAATAMEHCAQPGERASRMVLGDSIRVDTDIVSTSSVTQNPAKMAVVFDHWVEIAENNVSMVRVTMFCGQRLVTLHEFDVALQDVVAQTNLAADRNFSFYKRLTDRAIEARALKLGISENELRKQLDLKVPGYEITFRELHRLPKPMRRSDFVPRELHLAPNPSIDGVLGVAWLNTGIVYYNPMGRVKDYVTRAPYVLQHEMIHNDVNLQKFPFAGGFDAELMASIPMMLYLENTTDMFYHGYAADLRELAWVFFGFNFRQTREDIVKYDLGGNIVLDAKVYHERFKQLQEIKAEMFSFFETIVLPEFYSDPIWWSAFNDSLKDSNAVFRVMMANHYDATILGGRMETATWQKVNEPVIMDIARRSFESLNESRGDKKSNEESVPSFIIERYRAMFTVAEQEALQKYAIAHNLTYRDIAKMKPNEVLEILHAALPRKGGTS